jgi:anti-sigma factor RsiW
MNRMNGDDIARFVDGSMSATERAAFEARLARDRSLRALVEAERSIRATISGELSRLPVEHAATRASMMSALASLPTAAPPGGVRPHVSPPRSPLLKWLGATGIGVAVIVGSYLYATREQPAPAPAPRATERTVTLPSMLDTMPTTSAIEPADAPAERNDSQRLEARGTRDPRGEASTPRTIERPASTSSERASSRDDQSEQVAPVAKKKELRVIDRDSVKIRIGVDEVR